MGWNRGWRGDGWDTTSRGGALRPSVGPVSSMQRSLTFQSARQEGHFWLPALCDRATMLAVRFIADKTRLKEVFDF